MQGEYGAAYGVSLVEAEAEAISISCARHILKEALTQLDPQHLYTLPHPALAGPNNAPYIL